MSAGGFSTATAHLLYIVVGRHRADRRLPARTRRRSVGSGRVGAQSSDTCRQRLCRLGRLRRPGRRGCHGRPGQLGRPTSCGLAGFAVPAGQAGAAGMASLAGFVRPARPAWPQIVGRRCVLLAGADGQLSWRSLGRNSIDDLGHSCTFFLSTPGPGKPGPWY